jgi:hypothetical protein
MIDERAERVSTSLKGSASSDEPFPVGAIETDRDSEQSEPLVKIVQGNGLSGQDKVLYRYLSERSSLIDDAPGTETVVGVGYQEQCEHSSFRH